ncbi:unnamed protein product [Somion occarium]|uniref:Uncharacterized protein n=1 Tax=Somion occarium TaxID=3059160 RepID=A0ABP1DQI2_9APHY
MQDVVITPPNGSTIFVEAACLITSTMYSMPKLRMISLESVRITGDQVTKELCRNLASFAPNPVGLHFNECEVSANIVVAIACALPNVTGLYLDNTSYPQRLPDLTDSDTQTLLPDSLNQSENDDSHTEARRATHPLHIHDDAVEMRRRYSSKLNLTVFKMRFIIHPEAYLEKIVQFSTSLDKISYAAFTVDLDDASHSLEPISKFIGRLGLGLNYLDVRLRRLSPWYFSGHWHSDLRSTGMKVTYPPSTCRKPRELLVYPELDAREIELVNQIAGMQFNGIQFNMWPPDVYHNSTWTLWCVEDDPDIPSDIPAAEYCMSYGLSGTLSLEEGPTFDTKCDGHFWRRTNENVSQLYGYAGRLRGNVKN